MEHATGTWKGNMEEERSISEIDKTPLRSLRTLRSNITIQ